MNAFPGDPWEPDPEQLAAYFDGELEGRDELAPLRERIEQWLSDNPKGRTESGQFRQFLRLWQQTTPQEPSNAVWNQMWRSIQSPAVPKPRRTASRWKPVAWVAGIAACLALVWVLAGNREPDKIKLAEKPIVKGAEEDEIFPVAVADEIRILRVEGRPYTQAMIVGQLPLDGPLELLENDEMSVTSIKPDTRDRPLASVGKDRPIIWAKLETED